MDAGHGGRRRHAVRGTDTSGGGWRMTGVVEFQVDNITLREMRWE